MMPPDPPLHVLEAARRRLDFHFYPQVEEFEPAVYDREREAMQYLLDREIEKKRREKEAHRVAPPDPGQTETGAGR